MNLHLPRVLGLAFGLSIAAIAGADCGASGCFSVYVEELYPEAQGGAWIKTSGDETLANCTVDGGVYLRLAGTTPGYKELYATLLAAQLADKKVSIHINQGSNPCSIAYITLNRNS